MGYWHLITYDRTMSLLVVIQTIVAMIIIGIALWALFHLLKALIPYKKSLAALSLLSIVGIFMYDQVYREYRLAKDSQTHNYETNSLLSFDSDDSGYEQEYDDSCSSLPQYCYEMASCSQAEEALECGNYDLDRDDDGVPCESLCGNY